jgi:multidrug efflux pump subunit AcrA (membrane-fusion protein)
VTIGLQTPAKVEILSGLQNGDQVVVGRHSGLSDGEKVTPRAASYESDAGSYS